MSSSAEVGSGQVAIFPTFKGFRKAVNAETEDAAKAADTGFRRIFSKAGEASGRSTGVGFKRTFEGSATGFSAKAQKELETAVARSAKALSSSRLKEQDAAGKARVADKQLAEARKRYADDSSQVVRAEERLAAANRKVEDQQRSTKAATDDLRSAQSRLASAADRAGDELEQSGRRSGSRFGTGFKSVLGGSFLGTALANFAGQAASGVANAFAEAGRLAWDYLQDGVGSATDLEQSVGAVDAVFKDNASTIHEWAKSASNDVGLSQNSFNELSTVLGAQLKNMGFDLEDATTRTGDLVKLGADLAAQFGGTTTDAVSALSSLLRGERDPIERYGVSINEARIQAKLAAMGLSDLEGEAATSAKTQATLALLYEQTADAQGTFARESDTLAGQQQRLNAQWQDAQSTLGMALLPALTELTKAANQDLIPAFQDMIEQIGPELGQALTDSTPQLIELLQATAEYLPDLVELGVAALPIVIEAFKLLLPVMQLVAENQGGIMTVFSLMVDLMNGASFEEIYRKLQDLGGFFGTLRDLIQDTMDRAVAFLQIGDGILSGDPVSAVAGLIRLQGGRGAGQNVFAPGRSVDVPAFGQFGSASPITQNNYFAEIPADEAINAVGQRLASTVRRARM